MLGFADLGKRGFGRRREAWHPDVQRIVGIFLARKVRVDIHSALLVRDTEYAVQVLMFLARDQVSGNMNGVGS